MRLFDAAALLVALSPFTLASPTPIRRDAAAWLGEPIKSWLGKRIVGTPTSNSPSCDLANAQMPAAPTPLPPPSDGLVLSHVAVGRGTQNYTCADSSPSTIPQAVGAVASLFNASCIAATYPELLSVMTDIALNYPIPESTNEMAPAVQMLSGHHFFSDNTTPVFNLDTDLHTWGIMTGKKLNSTTAPTTAIKGVSNQGDGAVAWLKIVAKNATDAADAGFKEVYRLNTAGGSPPTTCENMPQTFEVQYSAEYWLWA